MTLNKQWNWSSSTKLNWSSSTVSASWTQLELLNRIQWSKVQIPLTSTFYSYFRALQWWIPYIIYMKNILLLHFKILLFWTTVFSKRQEKLVPCINGKKTQRITYFEFCWPAFGKFCNLNCTLLHSNYRIVATIYIQIFCNKQWISRIIFRLTPKSLFQGGSSIWYVWWKLGYAYSGLLHLKLKTTKKNRKIVPKWKDEHHLSHMGGNL